MKCPWITETIHKPERYGNYGRIPAKDIVKFGDCLKEECPFWGKEVKEHRQEGGYRTVTRPICRRAEKEKNTAVPV